MKVRVYPADQYGCGHYRLIWPSEALQRRGYDVEVVNAQAGDHGGIRGIWSQQGRIEYIELDESAREVDVFVFQRPSHTALLDVILRLRERGKTVVVDMDDNLSRIHPKNAAFRMLHPRFSPHNNWHNVRKACAAATLITVSTPQLQGVYGTRSTNRVLRNCIPRHALECTPRAKRWDWGWAGALYSHPDDVPMLGGAVAQLNREGRTFGIVGDGLHIGRALGIGDDPPATGVVPFDDWIPSLTMLGVGVAPLADSRFNECKSWLKPLEYAAAGVPWVASDRPEYRELCNHVGGGTLVGDRTRDWVRALRGLLEDDRRRTLQGAAAKESAAKFVIDEHAESWWETWETARQLDTQRNRRPARNADSLVLP